MKLTRTERGAAGKALREQCPRNAHARWKSPADRCHPIELLIASGVGRVPQVEPIRYGRMKRSPPALDRGAAAIIAADVARTPVSGIRVQACANCHQLNFGGFAKPERRVIININRISQTRPINNH